MWELIKANQRKSMLLFILMGLCLVLLGFLTGNVVNPSGGGIGGIFIAIMIWVVLSLVSYFSGSSILLSVSNAKEVKPEVHPQLYNIVEEMKIAGQLPVIPRIFIINEEAPNAFATGRDPEHSAIAVTAGLLSRLNRDELQGVVAHETSHILNRDIRFMTFAGIMLGSIVLISEVFLRGLFYSSSGRYHSSDAKGGGQMQLIMMILALVMAILVPVLARLLYFSISRKREYLADASAVRLTRYPEGLASALEKISGTTQDLKAANKVTAPMYIVNPLKKQGRKLASLSSTHPPVSERIRILRSISGGVNYRNYQEAYSFVKGTSSSVIPVSGLADQDHIEIRETGGTVGMPPPVTEEKRMFGDLVMGLNNYIFIPCDCGLKLKIPPDFTREKITCPKCGKIHQIH